MHSAVIKLVNDVLVKNIIFEIQKRNCKGLIHLGSETYASVKATSLPLSNWTQQLGFSIIDGHKGNSLLPPNPQLFPASDQLLPMRYCIMKMGCCSCKVLH